MTFTKGHPPFLLKHTEETKIKMSKSKKGKPSARKGIKLSEETKKRMSEAQKKSPHRYTKSIGNKSRAGQTVSAKEMAKRISSLSGEKCYRWIKDRTLVKGRQNRNNPEYKQWRFSVWRRDNFKCRMKDNNCSGRIEAHHIEPWSEKEGLRYIVSNGITLCHAHHPSKRAEEKRLAPLFIELVSESYT